MHLCSPRNAHPNPRRRPNPDATMLRYITAKQRAGRSYGRHLTNYEYKGALDPTWFIDGLVIGRQAIATSISLPSEEQKFHAISLYANNIAITTTLDCPILRDGEIGEATIFSRRMRPITKTGFKEFMLSDRYEIDEPWRYAYDEQDFRELRQLQRTLRTIRTSSLRAIVGLYRKEDVSVQLSQLEYACSQLRL